MSTSTEMARGNNWKTNRRNGGKFKTLGQSGGMAERRRLIAELRRVSDGSLPVMLSEWTLDELYHEVEYRHKLHHGDPEHRGHERHGGRHP